MLWWVEYRIDCKLEHNTNTTIQHLNSKIDSLQSTIIHIDSSRVISIGELKENKKSIDSLIQVLKENKKDSMNINKALDFLENYIKK